MKYPYPSYAGDSKRFAEKLESYMINNGLGIAETAKQFNVSSDCIETLLDGCSSWPTDEFLERFIELTGLFEI